MSKKNEKTKIPQTPDENNDEILVVEEESKGKRILNVVVNVILVLAIALAALCTYTSYVASSGNGVPSVFGIRMFSIQTESMYPTLLPGDLIFDTAVKDPGELRNNDIITYWTVINGERVLNTHRIEQIYDGGGYLIFSTKGDNNTSADPLTVHESEIVGKYSFRIESLGKFFDYLQTSTGFLIVVVVPVFLFFLFHLVQFFRVLFEYQNVKNRIKYEQERGRTEDLLADEKRKQKEAQAQAREKMEAELRERLRAEIMATMAAQKQPEEPAPAEEPKAEEPAQEPKVEEPAEEIKTEAPAEEPKAEELLEESKMEETAEEPVQEPAAGEVEEEQSAGEAPKEEKPALDEAAIEAMIAKQRAAIEAELREKIRAEMLASMETPAAEAAQTENNAEETANA